MTRFSRANKSFKILSEMSMTFGDQVNSCFIQTIQKSANQAEFEQNVMGKRKNSFDPLVYGSVRMKKLRSYFKRFFLKLSGRTHYNFLVILP